MNDTLTNSEIKPDHGTKAERPLRPVALVPIFDNIPAELKSMPRWVCWCYQWKQEEGQPKGHWTKIPKNAQTGYNASSTDAKSWSSFDQAKAAYESGGYDGVGIVHLHSDNVTGMDGDHCLDNGAIMEPIKQHVETLDTYTEKSPSANGLRAFAFGIKPGRSCSKRKLGSKKNVGIEYYDGLTTKGIEGGRFLTITGHHLEGSPKTVNQRQEQIEQIYNELFGTAASEERPLHNAVESLDESPQANERPVTEAEQAFIDGAGDGENVNQRERAKFERLVHRSRTATHGNRSDEDFAVCCFAVENGLPADYVFSRIKDASKIVERGRSYFEGTWEKAVKKVHASMNGHTPKEPTWDITVKPSPNIEHAQSKTPSVNVIRPSGNTGTSSDDAADLPSIIVTTDEKNVNDQSIRALSRHRKLFKRGGLLVTPVRQSKASDKHVKHPAGAVHIKIVEPAPLREMMTQVAVFKKKTVDRNGEFKIVAARPHDLSAKQILARGEWPEFRHLESVVETPVLRPDGSILDTPGWDPATGLLYLPSCNFPKITALSYADAVKAAAYLLRLVCDFPFGRDHHRAAWLSALLSPFARYAFDGPCPLFCIDANVAGSGKTKLVDITSIAKTGRIMPRSAFSDDEKEVKKTITAIAIAGDELFLFDNLEQGLTLKSSALDSALTGRTWKDRILGGSQMTHELPLNTIFYVTGNNVAIGGDIERRIVWAHLECLQENPEERTNFTIPDLLQYVRDHRAEIVVQSLTILKAYCMAGRPKPPGMLQYGSFEAWSDLVRGAVLWATGHDPCGSRLELRAANIQKSTLPALIRAWEKLDPTGQGLTTAMAVKLCTENHPDAETLKEIISEWASKAGTLPSTGTVGYRLRDYRGRVVGAKRIVSVENRTGVQVWRVESVADDAT